MEHISELSFGIPKLSNTHSTDGLIEQTISLQSDLDAIIDDIGRLTIMLSTKLGLPMSENSANCSGEKNVKPDSTLFGINLNLQNHISELNDVRSEFQYLINQL